MPKPKKHPKDMTTEEAIYHLFKKKGAKHIKSHVARLDREKSTKRG
jgi:hypothetical protein